MKLTFTFIILVYFSFSATAQLEKKTWLVGGIGNVYSYSRHYSNELSYSNFKNLEITLSNSTGYFFANKFVAGIRPAFYLLRSNVSYPNGQYTSHNLKFSIGPFVRYYLLNKDKVLNVITDITYQFGFNKETEGGSSGNVKAFSIMGGPVIFFNSSVGLEVLLGYSSKEETFNTLVHDEIKGFQTNIGFTIHLNK